MLGGTVGEVVESRNPGFSAGDKMSGLMILPNLSKETFCPAIPIRCAKSQERVLRRASMTSRFTTIGMESNDLRVVAGQFSRRFKNMRKRQDEDHEHDVEHNR
jgi:hypothetical protein